MKERDTSPLMIGKFKPFGKQTPNYNFLNSCEECKSKDKTIEIQRETIERLYDELEYYKKILYGGNK
jgi:hypothetical protein